MRSLPVLDLVAVAYEAPEETEAFLASLRHVDVPFTLTIIDNASPNEAVRSAIQCNLHTVQARDHCRSARYVFNTKNVGYARAVNQGMKMGSAPYAAILNCDTEFLPEGVSKLVAHFMSHESVGVIGPRTFDSAGRITHAGIITTAARPRNHHRGWLSPDPDSYQDTLSVNTVSGATYFVRRSMWDELSACADYLRAAPTAEGAFLPTPHYFEETFCSYHARHHGWEVIYLGAAAMIHQWHRSSPVGSMAMEGAQRQFHDACAQHGIVPVGEL